MSINATTPAHAAEASSDEDSVSTSASPSSSTHASASAATSASSQTDATATPAQDPVLQGLLAELFGLKVEASSTSHPAPTPCFDPAVWAACQGSSTTFNIMTTVQLLIAMRQGAPYTVERFIETFTLLAKVFKQKRDELKRQDRAQGVSFP